MSQKQKIMVSISSDLVKWIDDQKKNKIFSSRSHGVEFCVFKRKKEEEPTDA